MVRCRKCKSSMPDGARFCMDCGAALFETPATKKPKPKKRPNGTGTVTKRSNGHYQARVTLYYYIGADGKKHRKTRAADFPTAAEAYKALATLKEEKTQSATLSALYEIYTSSKKYDALSENQKKRTGYAWRRLEPLHFADIAELTVDEMQTTIDEAVSTYYPAKDMKTLLSHLYNLAAQRDIVRENKTAFVELPEFTEPEKTALTDAEVDALWKDWTEHHEPLTGYLLIMLYCGLRYGEIATIRTENIHVSEGYMIGGIKTKAGKNREIPICNRIKPVISALMTDIEHLMTIDKTTFYDSYKAIFSRCGLRDVLVPHSLRHTFFTRLAADSTISGAVISAAGGHARYSTTVDNYVHIPLADKLAAVNKMR